MEVGEDSHASSAAGTFQHIQSPYALHQFGPRIVRPWGTAENGSAGIAASVTPAKESSQETFVSRPLLPIVDSAPVDDAAPAAGGTIADLHFAAGVPSKNWIHAASR